MIKNYLENKNIFMTIHLVYIFYSIYWVGYQNTNKLKTSQLNRIVRPVFR